MWPLTSFTKENGATLLWPGSHQGDGATELSEAGASAAVCEPGDALVWLGGTLHGAGANNSDEPRRGIIVSYRSEEHTSELQSLMRISYSVFCLKKKNNITTISNHNNRT